MEKPQSPATADILGKTWEELLQGWEGSLNTDAYFQITIGRKMVDAFKYMQTVQQVK